MDKNIFKNIAKLLQEQKVFVCYKNKSEQKITLLSQKDDILYTVTNFNIDQGFVFYPFDKGTPVLIAPDKIIISDLIKEQQTFDYHFNCSFESDDINTTPQKKYISNVEVSKEKITKKEFQKVVVSRCKTIDYKYFSILETFDSLLQSYPNAFVYLWYHPKVGCWIGATPEVFAQIEKKQFTTMSLAGTQKIENDINLQWRQKEIEEQKFVTDYIQNILQKYASKVKIESVKNVQIGDLIHIENKIIANLRTQIDVNKLFLDLHPTPAVCGVGKQKAKQFILEQENHYRSFYTGFLGELNMNNKTNLFVNLRCMQVLKNKLVLYAGAGITKDSVAKDEWIETQNKINILERKLIYKY